jgi:hypothetical protein
MQLPDIRIPNLLSIIEADGYRLSHSLYYVKDETHGLHGL